MGGRTGSNSYQRRKTQGVTLSSARIEASLLDDRSAISVSIAFVAAEGTLPVLIRGECY